MNNTNLTTNLMLLCDYAIIAKDGKASFVGVFEELKNIKPPIILGRGFLAATFTGTPNSTHQISVKAEHGNKNENILKNLEMSFTVGPNGRGNLLIELIGVQFPQPGIYHFRIYDGEEVVGSTDLKVIRIKSDNQGEPN